MQPQPDLVEYICPGCAGYIMGIFEPSGESITYCGFCWMASTYTPEDGARD